LAVISLSRDLAVRNLAHVRFDGYLLYVKISAFYVQPFWSYSQKTENLDLSARKTAA